MQRKKFLALIAVALVLSGCQESGETQVVLGTAATTGMFFFVGAAVGNAVSHSTDLNVLVQSTAGSMENIFFVQSGDIDIGMANSDALYGAFHGALTFEAAGRQNIVQVATLYTSSAHLWVRADSDIHTWSDLRGRRVSLGTAGATHAYFAQQVMQNYGINWQTDLGTHTFMDVGEASSRLADGDIDAAFVIGGAPLAGIEASIVTTPFRFISISEAVIDELIRGHPFLIPYTMRAGTYSGQDQDVQSFGLATSFFASPRLPAETVYTFVRGMMESLPTFHDTNSATRQISVDTVWTSVIPLHPGAEQFYRSQGWID